MSISTLVLDTLADAPQPNQDPDTFNAKAFAFAAILHEFGIELNAFGAALNSLDTSSSSTTSLAIGNGNKTLVTDTGKSYQLGMTVKLASTASPGIWMLGDVTLYNPTTGALEVDVYVTKGSGTYASWVISMASVNPNPINESQGANIASSSTINLDASTGNYVHVTGVTTINAITLEQGAERTIVFDGALTLTHSSSVIIPFGNSIITSPGDVAIFRGEASGVVRCVSYQFSESKVGETFIWAGPSIPSYALLQNGAAVSRTTYSALFSVIGTFYGAGDGSTTFNIPSVLTDNTIVQANSNLGTTTTGDVKSHFHSYPNQGGVTTGAGITVPAISGGSVGAQNTSSTGGSANLPAGLRQYFCIRFRD